jgi:hypothetical protein
MQFYCSAGKTRGRSKGEENIVRKNRLKRNNEKNNKKISAQKRKTQKREGKILLS